MGLGNIERKIRSDSAYQRKEAELLIEKFETILKTNYSCTDEDVKR